MSVRRLIAASLALAALAALPAAALQPRQTAGRFDQLVKTESGAVIGTAGRAVADLPQGDPLRAAWEQFSTQNGGWRVHVDERSGLPLLASGRGIDWLPVGQPVTIAALEAKARDFLAQHAVMMQAGALQLQLDPSASAQLTNDVWQLTFRQVVGGVPVEGARYDFHVARGRLVAFGAAGIAAVTRSATPTIDVAQARGALDAYLGARSALELRDVEAPSLRLLPLDPQAGTAKAWNGARGAGYTHALVWRFALQAPGEAPTWVALVDADNGAVRSLIDDTKYDQIKGGIYPVSDDGFCPTGCEQPGFPMPFADYSVDGGPAQTAGDMGMYTCSTVGANIRTHLAGPYVRVSTSCGAVNEATTCDNPLDLSQSTGTDCVVPAGATSPGDTHSARSSFYHLNRVMQKGRAWLPSNTWLASQLTDNLDIFSTCNAYWDGASVNFYRSGGGCRNTGEIAGVFVHEWGHGIDNFDGGGYDNPSEAYADTVAFFETRESCIGRGFYADNHNCSGYGDSCLNCSGIRDQDWNMHASHTPANAAWANSHCGGGGGPCGKEPHCEAYISSEAIWDLAVRDLPAAGVDTASAWQLAEKLWYKSRNGSGGNAYNCSGSTSDGCGAAAWHHKFLLIDDDDANLANGTPHAAAIFAAFNRHGIACGAAGDAANQNHSSCPALAKPVINATANTNTVNVAWTPVTNAASYTILRNELGCDRAQIIIDSAAAPATSYPDGDVPNSFPLYYRVQAVGSNSACESPVSDCVQAQAQPFAGLVKFGAPTWGCSNSITLSVTDANVGASTVSVDIWSTSEPTPETVILNEIAPGAGKFIGTITSTSGPAVHGDGMLSIVNGNAMTARYVDTDDGAGNHGVIKTDNATADCVFPIITGVGTQSVTDTAATVAWTTDELSDTVLVWGPVKPPSSNSYGDARTTAHAVSLSGLTACTVYWYEVHSTDPASNVAISNNGGQYYHFETLGNFGQGLQPCHAGKVTLDKPIYYCADTVGLRLVDMDLNVSPVAADTALIYVTSTTEPAGEWITVTETGANTSIFTGSIQTTSAAPAADGKISTTNGDTLTATYRDKNDGTGTTAMSYATSALDCTGPAISNLSVQTITNARATIHFTTSEPGTTTVEWGTTAALGQSSTKSALVTTHDLVLNQADSCQKVYFRVRSKDTYGNERIADGGGTPFVYSLGQIPGLYWRDSFENGSANWTLTGEFEIGAPQGKGGSGGGYPDPSSAYNNTKVLGNDLTGRGTYLGDYEVNANDTARMAYVNATTWVHTKLLFYKRLNVTANDDASLWLWTTNGVPVYRSSGTTVNDNDFAVQTADLSSRVDGQVKVALEFRMKGSTGTHQSGWNIDEVILKDGTLPDFGACGGCGGSPTFAGATSAVDNNACAAAGVTVSWAAAPAWGTGTTGTYAVYRGTAPGFPADAAHMLASGVATLSYNDTTAPAGTLYYLVRAENDETCSTGPKNHGTTDANTAYVAVTKTTSRPIPPAVLDLKTAMLGGAHVRLSWTAVSDATTYHVFRALNPHPGNFGLLGTASGVIFDDLGSGATLENYYYLVKGVNACGTEGP